jgi:hypothetical protein
MWREQEVVGQWVFGGFGLCGGDFLIGGFDLVRRAALPPFVGERLR